MAQLACLRIPRPPCRWHTRRRKVGIQVLKKLLDDLSVHYVLCVPVLSNEALSLSGWVRDDFEAVVIITRIGPSCTISFHAVGLVALSSDGVSTSGMCREFQLNTAGLEYLPVTSCETLLRSVSGCGQI